MIQHAERCAYHFGGDCTCGAVAWPEDGDLDKTETELDLYAELRNWGIDPSELNKKMLARLIKARDEEGIDTPMLHEAIRQFSESDK